MTAAVSPDGAYLAARDASSHVLLVPLDGSPPKPLPWVSPDDAMVRWTPDGQALLVYLRNEMPSRLDRIDVKTGRRTTLRVLAPPDPAGAIAIWDVAVADDDSYYAYSLWQQRSTLFLIDGAK